ncbi:MAG: glycosyltransferase family 4 protein [Candidatus Krumholzibacteria bacterium]|nr:glycosyltransferase family 4 protein [Candidatus Krumholzibacteria bacterium]MDH4335891.1 glycosyltransferase family 4 protein [Candidatus Krumholzibacteria bacterium]MDH5268533.1 glycosyltransferase family 4 protein [Candidatus Krumholzibacteria bacterium]
MKVCIVSPRLTSYYGVTGRVHFGGAEVQAAFVADALRAAGQEVVLVVTDLPNGTSLPLPAENAFYSADGLPGLRFFHPRWSGVMAALERANADVYYQRNAGMITGLVAMHCRRRRRPFVYGAGSDGDFDPRAVTVGGFRDRMLFRYGLNRCAGIVVQNETQRAAAETLGRPVRLIPNGIAPAPPQEAGTRDIIVWIGSLWSVKRPDLLLELARRVPEREFVVLGGDFPSEPEFSARVREEAAKLPNVTMMGRRPHDEVATVLSRAALLVNTSAVEGFPNAYLEAWNQGVPVVTFNDIDGLIREAGVGVVTDSLDGMVAAVRDLVDETARRALGDAARGYIRDRFSPERLGAAYTEYFSSLRQGAASAR